MKHRAATLSLLGVTFIVGACGQISEKAATDTPSPQNTQAAMDPILLPTGAWITPLAAEGATLQALNPGLPNRPDFTAGQAVSTAVSPDGNLLLVLTSGYNRNYGSDGQVIPAESNEYVFIFDIQVDPPAQLQVIQVPNTHDGLAWTPDGSAFVVSGGRDDTVHLYQPQGEGWAESMPAIALGHGGIGLGLGVPPHAAGIAVTLDGTRAVVANYENDSVSILDLNAHSVIGELELRPGKIDPAERGIPGGEFPFWVAIRGNEKAYVSSERDREVVVISLADPPHVSHRITVGGQPNKMLLNQRETRLYVANGNSDSVSVIDTSTEMVIEEIPTTAPPEIFRNAAGLKGANPNSLALSPDQRTLYVSNGGTNSVSVVRLGSAAAPSAESDSADLPSSPVIGLIPTGWYPHSVSLSADGSRLFVVNGKGIAGPNPGGCRNNLSTDPTSQNECTSHNQYPLQLEKAALLSLPVPQPMELAQLTWRVALNNHFLRNPDPEEERLMQFLRSRIHHVIYSIKENRTYDQVLGDLEVGNGDPDLNLFPEELSPNHHALARNFVVLDAFQDSGEVSGVGWNWSTAARTTDIIEKTQFPNYAGRGLSYDWEGTNRNINVGFATVEERQAAFALTPDDPDLLPGTLDSAAPEAPGGSSGAEYLWDAAMNKGLSVRNYGCFGDLARYGFADDDPNFIPVVENPFEQGIRQFYPAKPSLMDITDIYYRGYDQKNADFYLFREWEREFDQYAENGDLPALEFVRFAHDHFGEFARARWRVNTPDRQFADNDYAIGQLVDKIAHSRYANDTLIFIIEDDAQNGPDHVDAHRSVAYVVGPYVKQGGVVSRSYNTVAMVRTIEDLLGLDPMGITDGLAGPMAAVFDPSQLRWTYDALVPDVLHSTDLPVPAPTPWNTVATGRRSALPLHDAAYWGGVMAGQDFSKEDAVDDVIFNRALWRGLKGEHVSYPEVRDGRDLSINRRQRLEN